MSAPSLRYLDQVRGEIDGFMQQRVQNNYFTGEAGVPLSTTLQEVEVLYGASDTMKELASTGELQALHERVSALREASDQQYQNIRDRLLNVIKTSQDEQAEILRDALAARQAGEEPNVDHAEQCGRLRVEIQEINPPWKPNLFRAAAVACAPTFCPLHSKDHGGRVARGAAPPPPPSTNAALGTSSQLGLLTQ